MADIIMKSTLALPEDCFMDNLYLYKSKNMYMTLTKAGVDYYEAGGHVHDGYEFLIPLTAMPNVGLGKDKLSAGKGVIIPINPGQSHGVAEAMNNCRFINIMVDSNYFHETASIVCGNKYPNFKKDIINLSSETQYTIKSFIKEAKYSQSGKDLILNSLCCQFTVGILREAASGNTPGEQKYINGNQKKIMMIVDYLNDNYQEDCSLEELAGMAGTSRYHFIRTFKKITGKSPYDYLIDIRIEKAKELLKIKGVSIAEVGTKCGFNNISHFSVVFRERMGETPSRYREKVSF